MEFNQVPKTQCVEYTHPTTAAQMSTIITQIFVRDENQIQVPFIA